MNRCKQWLISACWFSRAQVLAQKGIDQTKPVLVGENGAPVAGSVHDFENHAPP
jgi:hypothetical protein